MCIFKCRLRSWPRIPLRKGQRYDVSWCSHALTKNAKYYKQRFNWLYGVNSVIFLQIYHKSILDLPSQILSAMCASMVYYETRK